MVAVTHDRYFLDNVARMIVDIDGGAVRGFRGNYTAWLKLKAERSRVAEKAIDARAKRMQAELEWIRSTPKGGRGASRARAREYEKLVADADASRDAERVQSGAIAIVPGPRLGNLVLAADGVTKEISPRSAPRCPSRCPEICAEIFGDLRRDLRQDTHHPFILARRATTAACSSATSHSKCRPAVSSA